MKRRIGNRRILSIAADAASNYRSNIGSFAGGAVWRGRQIVLLSVISWETDADEGKLSAVAIIRAWRIVNQQPEVPAQ